MEGETWTRIDLINLPSTSRKGEGSRHAFLSFVNTARLGDIVVNFSWDGAWHVDENISWLVSEYNLRQILDLGSLNYDEAVIGGLKFRVIQSRWVWIWIGLTELKGTLGHWQWYALFWVPFQLRYGFMKSEGSVVIKKYNIMPWTWKTSSSEQWKALMPACEHVSMMMFTASQSCGVFVFVKILWDKNMYNKCN